MKPIVVNVDRLKEIVSGNREQHQAKYEKALVVYQEKVREWLEAQLALIAAGDFDHVQRVCPYPLPEIHLDDYDTALGMLDWHVGETYELDEVSFEQFIQDQWGWHRSFMANTASYLVDG